MEETVYNKYTSFEDNNPAQHNISKRLINWVFNHTFFNETPNFSALNQWKTFVPIIEYNKKKENVKRKCEHNKWKERNKPNLLSWYNHEENNEGQMRNNNIESHFNIIQKKQCQKIIKRSEDVFNTYQRQLEEEERDKRILEKVKNTYLKKCVITNYELDKLDKLEQRKPNRWKRGKKGKEKEKGKTKYYNYFFLLTKGSENKNVFFNTIKFPLKTTTKINKYFEKNILKQLDYYNIKEELFIPILNGIREITKYYPTCEGDILNTLKVKYFPCDKEEAFFYFKGIAFSNCSIYFDNVELINPKIVLIDTETVLTYEQLNKNVVKRDCFNVSFFNHLLKLFCLYDKVVVLLIHGEINYKVKKLLLDKQIYFFTYVKKKNINRFSSILQTKVINAETAKIIRNIKTTKNVVKGFVAEAEYFKIEKYKKNVKNIFICCNNSRFLTLCIYGGQWILKDDVDCTSNKNYMGDYEETQEKKSTEKYCLHQFKKEIEKENVLNHFIQIYYKNKHDDYILKYFFLNKEEQIKWKKRTGHTKNINQTNINHANKENDKNTISKCKGKQNETLIRKTDSRKQILINHIKNIIVAKKLKKVVQYFIFLSFYIYKHIYINTFMNRTLVSSSKNTRKNSYNNANGCSYGCSYGYGYGYDIDISTSILYTFYLIYPSKKKTTPINLISSLFHLLKLNDPLACERVRYLAKLINKREIIKEQIYNNYEFCFGNADKNKIIDIVNFFLFNNFMNNSQKEIENIWYYLKTINSMQMYYNNHHTLLDDLKNDLFLNNIKIEIKATKKIERIIWKNILFYSHHIKTAKSVEMIIYFICPTYMHINPSYSIINLYHFDSQGADDNINTAYYLFYNFLLNYNYIHDITIEQFASMIYIASFRLMCPFEHCKNLVQHHQICFQVFTKKVLFTFLKNEDIDRMDKNERLLMEILCNKCGCVDEKVMNICISLGEFLLCIIHSSHYKSSLCNHSSSYASYSFYFKEIKINVEVYESDIYKMVGFIKQRNKMKHLKNVEEKIENENEKEKKKANNITSMYKNLLLCKVEEKKYITCIKEEEKKEKKQKKKKKKNKKKKKMEKNKTYVYYISKEKAQREKKRIKQFIKKNIKNILRTNVLFYFPCTCVMKQNHYIYEKKTKRTQLKTKELSNFNLYNIIEYFPCINSSLLPMYTSLKFLIYNYIIKYYRSKNKHLYIKTDRKERKKERLHNPCVPLYFKNICDKCKYIKITEYSILILANLLFIIKRIFSNFYSFLGSFIYFLVKQILVKKVEIHSCQNLKKNTNDSNNNGTNNSGSNNETTQNVDVYKSLFEKNDDWNYVNNEEVVKSKTKEQTDIINWNVEINFITNSKRSEIKVFTQKEIKDCENDKILIKSEENVTDEEEKLMKEYFLLQALLIQVKKYRKLLKHIFLNFYLHALTQISKKSFLLDIEIFFSLYIIQLERLSLCIQKKVKTVETWRNINEKNYYFYFRKYIKFTEYKKKKIRKIREATNIYHTYNNKDFPKIEKKKEKKMKKKKKLIRFVDSNKHIYTVSTYEMNCKRKKKQRTGFSSFTSGNILEWYKKEKNCIYNIENTKIKRKADFTRKTNYKHSNKKYFYMHIVKLLNLVRKKKNDFNLFFIKSSDIGNLIFHSLLSPGYKKRLKEIYLTEKKKKAEMEMKENKMHASVINPTTADKQTASSENCSPIVGYISSSENLKSVITQWNGKKHKSEEFIKDIRKYVNKERNRLQKPLHENNIRFYLTNPINEIISVTLNRDATVHVYFPLQFYFLRKCVCKNELAFLQSLKKSNITNFDIKKKKFFKTHDEKYIIKEINKHEFRLYVNKFTYFFEYLSEVLFKKKASFLCLIYGLFQIEINKKNRKYIKTFIILENVKIRKKNAKVLIFDIKGARKKRNLQMLLSQHNNSPFLKKQEESFFSSYREKLIKKDICSGTMRDDSSLINNVSYNFNPFKKYGNDELFETEKRDYKKSTKSDNRKQKMRNQGSYSVPVNMENEVKQKKQIRWNTDIYEKEEGSIINDFRETSNNKKKREVNGEVESYNGYNNNSKPIESSEQNFNQTIMEHDTRIKQNKRTYIGNNIQYSVHWKICKKKVKGFKIRQNEKLLLEKKETTGKDIKEYLKEQRNVLQRQSKKNIYYKKNRKYRNHSIRLYLLPLCEKRIMNNSYSNHYEMVHNWSAQKEEEEEEEEEEAKEQVKRVEMKKYNEEEYGSFMFLSKIEHSKKGSAIYNDFFGSAYSLDKYNEFMTDYNTKYQSLNTCCVLLDDNFRDFTKGRTINLEYTDYKYFLNALKNDTEFLSSLDIMDYSLLIHIDIHNFRIIFKIIDYLRPYTWDKSVENFSKSVLYLAKGYRPTIIPSEYYKIRFLNNIKKYFFYYVPLYIFYKKNVFHFSKKKNLLQTINATSAHTYKPYFFFFLFRFLIQFGDVQHTKQKCSGKGQIQTNVFSLENLLTILNEYVTKNLPSDKTDDNCKNNRNKIIDSQNKNSLLQFSNNKQNTSIALCENYFANSHMQLKQKISGSSDACISSFSPVSSFSYFPLSLHSKNLTRTVQREKYIQTNPTLHNFTKYNRCCPDDYEINAENEKGKIKSKNETKDSVKMNRNGNNTICSQSSHNGTNDDTNNGWIVKMDTADGKHDKIRNIIENENDRFLYPYINKQTDMANVLAKVNASSQITETCPIVPISINLQKIVKPKEEDGGEKDTEKKSAEENGKRKGECILTDIYFDKNEIDANELKEMKREMLHGISKIQTTILKKIHKKLNITNVKDYVHNNLYLEMDNASPHFSNVSYVHALNMHRIYEATRKKQNNKKRKRKKKANQLHLYVPSYFLFTLHQ